MANTEIKVEDKMSLDIDKLKMLPSRIKDNQRPYTPGTLQCFLAVIGIRSQEHKKFDLEVSATRLNTGEGKIQAVTNISVVAALLLSVIAAIFFAAPDFMVFFGMDEEGFEPDGKIKVTTTMYACFMLCALSTGLLMINVIYGLIFVIFLTEMDEDEVRKFDREYDVGGPLLVTLLGGIIFLMVAALIWSWAVLSFSFLIGLLVMYAVLIVALIVGVGHAGQAYVKSCGSIQQRIQLTATEVKNSLEEYVSICGLEQIDSIDFQQFMQLKYRDRGSSFAAVTQERMDRMFKTLLDACVDVEGDEAVRIAED
eukprot:gnl/MRDRNA2_/MRDRNA2_33990_c0_seq1.p1 gnl/MRDRNA2_/MRDRNA2_33990_c0~~gnl/MRDRNA2_/MRDRNA2_33990_c0_seq1.p1  ORF type:complete len:311 (+),score=57.19 gnl/MRDRNA2_/MRDRNA2_33990_c0_seq1:80-1012(+)